MNDLVELIQISPRIRLDIRYASSNNFVGRAVYPSSRCFLLRQTADRLHRVQLALERKGLGLKVFDGYRPLSVQKIFWSIVPDPRYVADPTEGSKNLYQYLVSADFWALLSQFSNLLRGVISEGNMTPRRRFENWPKWLQKSTKLGIGTGSKHNRGASVDLTVVGADGQELLMPTEFDDFTEKAKHSYQGGPKEALRNRDLLDKAMKAEGFISYEHEWWHYDDPDWKNFPILDIPIPS